MSRPAVFDLDLTLIHETRRDLGLWTGAITEALGVTVGPDEDWSTHPVHTDHGLLESLSRRHRGRSFAPEERVHFEARVVARLDAALVDHPGMFVPIEGAAALVRALLGRVALATGNIHPVTERKLRGAGLDVGMPCSCSADGIDRTELVARALRRIGWAPGAPATSFGDGVWDVRAARALGVGFVGVAADDAHEARLRAAGARHVVRDYADQGAVLALIEEAEAPAG